MTTIRNNAPAVPALPKRKSDGTVEDLLLFACEPGRVFDENNDTVVVTRHLLALAALKIIELRACQGDM